MKRATRLLLSLLVGIGALIGLAGPAFAGSDWHRPSGHEWSGPVSTECSGETLAQWTPSAFFTTPGTNIKASADLTTARWASMHSVYVIVEDRKGERVFFEPKGSATARKGTLSVITVCQAV